MCDDHSGVLVEIPTARVRGPHGRARGIDACIAPLVQALNEGGVPTVASCCGHGHRPGSVILKDGRWLSILPDRESAERIEDTFLTTAYGEPSPLLRALRELPLACPHRPTCPELGSYRCCWCRARETLERVGSPGGRLESATIMPPDHPGHPDLPEEIHDLMFPEDD